MAWYGRVGRKHDRCAKARPKWVRNDQSGTLKYGREYESGGWLGTSEDAPQCGTAKSYSTHGWRIVAKREGVLFHCWAVHFKANDELQLFYTI